jgi:COMPASS component SWD2
MVEGIRSLRFSMEVTRHLGLAYLPFGTPAAPTAEGGDCRINSVAFSDDGKYIYTASNDGVLGLVDVATGTRTAEFFSREVGCRLVTATHHSLGVLHAAATGGAITYHNLHENKAVRVFEGHSARVTSISMNPVSDHFLSVGLDGVFNVWDLRMAAPIGRGAFTASFADDTPSLCFQY